MPENVGRWTKSSRDAAKFLHSWTDCIIHQILLCCLDFRCLQSSSSTRQQHTRRILLHPSKSQLTENVQSETAYPSLPQNFISCRTSIYREWLARGLKKCQTRKQSCVVLSGLLYRLKYPTVPEIISCIEYARHFHIWGFSEDCSGRQETPNSWSLGEEWIRKH